MIANKLLVTIEIIVIKDIDLLLFKVAYVIQLMVKCDCSSGIARIWYEGSGNCVKIICG